MIPKQKKYIDYLEKIIIFEKKINIKNNKSHDLNNRIKTIELIVPVVGGFSAGKSTLINSFLGSDILSTNLTPETALATELRYSFTNYIEAIKPDNSIDRYEINQADEIKENAKEYKFLKLFLNNENLQKIEPLILVDMPGFDSPIELHNQAILNYLNKGIYFIVLTSVEDGNITKSMIRELSNINEFSKDFSFCLSKSNLRAKTEVDSIKMKIEEQLEDYFDLDKKVIPVTNNGGENLKNILCDVNMEELFEKIFDEELKYNYFQNEDSLNTIISTLKTSKEDTLIAIKELKQGITRIIIKKEAMIKEVQHKYSNHSVNSIIEAISRELLNNQDTLVNMAISNSDSFSREINDIVKNTLIYEIKTKIKDASDDIVDDFSIELKDLSNHLSGFEFDEEWIDKISNSTKNILEKAQNGMNTMLEDRKESTNTDTTFKTITTILGLTTTIINPILEVIIVILPQIISLFTGKSQEAKQKAEITNKFLTDIVPTIKSKLRTTIPDLFSQQINIIINSISDEFESQLKQKEQEIQKTQEEKEHNIKDIEEEINKLESIKLELKTLATENLYKGSK